MSGSVAGGTRSLTARLRSTATLLVRVGPLVTVLAVLCVVLVERSFTGTLLGLGGCLLGALTCLAALQLGMLGGALAFGARVHDIAIGVGRRWTEWVTPRRTVTLRGLPIMLSVSVGPGRPPVRARMWAAALCSALAGVAVPVLLGLTAWSGSALWRGMVIGAAATALHALVPRQDAATTSTGWLLVGLPRMPAGRVADLEVSALADEALSAVKTGDLDAAEAATDRLAARFPDARATGATRVALLQARGRYAEALKVVLALVSDPGQTERDAAFMLAGLAGLAAATVEAGQAPAQAVLPMAEQALADAVQLGYPSFKLDGTRALLALVGGDPVSAARLARSAADTSDHVLSRADDLATLARAMMACGDNRAARTVLAEAEALAPWWPRVATTRARLDL